MMFPSPAFTVYRGAKTKLVVSLQDNREQAENLAGITESRVTIRASPSEPVLLTLTGTVVGSTIEALITTTESASVPIGVYLAEAAVKDASDDWFVGDPLYVEFKNPMTSF